LGLGIIVCVGGGGATWALGLERIPTMERGDGGMHVA